jgi:COP9 signalosome complex subunit 7
MAALDISNVRQLEDLLITHCFYTGLIKGRLDQKGRCLHVHECAPRDVRPSELPDILAAVHDWCDATLTFCSS